MKISARNQLAGKVESIEKGMVNAQVVVKLPGGQTLVSVITKESLENLALKPGSDVVALIKASDVMLAVD